MHDFEARCGVPLLLFPALRQQDLHEFKASLGYTMRLSENLPQNSDPPPQTPEALWAPKDIRVLRTGIIKTGKGQVVKS